MGEGPAAEMTPEPGSPVGHRDEERFACEVLRRVIRARFTEYDNNSRPRQVDGLFEAPDGTLGALEVTTFGDERALETEALTQRHPWHVEGLRWAWNVSIGDNVSVRSLRRHLPDLLGAFEDAGDTHPRRRAYRGIGPAFDWWNRADVNFVGFPSATIPKVHTSPQPRAGFVGEPFDEFPGWLSARLAEPDLTAKLEKLRETGRTDLHLFVRVHETGMPFRFLDAVGFSEQVPAVEFAPPYGLTGLWLAPRWRNPILRWEAARGWRREDVLD